MHFVSNDDHDILWLEDVMTSLKRPQLGKTVFFHETSCQDGIIRLNARYLWILVISDIDENGIFLLIITADAESEGYRWYSTQVLSNTPKEHVGPFRILLQNGHAFTISAYKILHKIDIYHPMHSATAVVQVSVSVSGAYSAVTLVNVNN